MFKQVAEKWTSIGGKIPVQWTSAHMDTKGIDIADGEAKRYYRQLNPRGIVHTLAYARRTAQKTKNHKWVNDWKRRQVSGIKKLPRVGA